MRKSINRILTGAFLFSLVVTACNNKKEDKKEETKTDTVVKDMTMPAPPEDTTKKDSGDVMDTRPVKPGE